MSIIQPEKIRCIAVVRPGQLGDVLLAIPGLRALRKGFPDAEIVLIGQQWALDLPQRLPYIDRVLTSPEMMVPSPDLVIQIQGDEPWAAKIALALGGRVTVGFCRDEQLGAAFQLHLHMLDTEPEVLRVIRLVRSLGIQPDGTHLEFPLLPEDSAELESIPELAGLLLPDRGDLNSAVVIHPGARAPARRWPIDRFAELASLIYRQWGTTLLIVGGAGEEPLAESVREMSGVSAINLAGRLSIGGLAALLSRSDLFVGNDSGPAQLAAAVAPRSLRLVGPANVHRWAPLDQDNHRVIHRNVECCPCNHWECPTNHRCLAEITVDQVLAEVGKLLA